MRIVPMLAALVCLMFALPAVAIPAPLSPDLPLGMSNELGAMLAAIAAAVVAVILRHFAQARRAAEIALDLAAAIEPLVLSAELAGGEGVAKYARVERQAIAWLEAQGVKGDARRLLERDLPELIEEAVRRLPK